MRKPASTWRPGRWLRRHRALFLLPLGAVLFVNLFVFGMAALALTESYRQHQARAEATSENIAQLVEHQLTSDFEKMDLSILAVVDEIERQLALEGGPDGQNLQRLFGRLQTRVSEIYSLGVASADGTVRHGTRASSHPAAVIRDRDFFTLQRNTAKNELVIGKPLHSDIDGQWMIPISRRLSHPDGSFAGVVYANISIEHINRDFAKVGVARNGSVALRNADLELVARHPMLGSKLSAIGTRILFPEVQAMIRAGKSSGTVVSRYPADNIERTVSFRRVSRYPLFILIGLSVEDTLEAWYAELAKTAAAIAVFWILTSLAGWGVWRSWKRERLQQLKLAKQSRRIRRDVEALQQAGLKARILAQAIEQSPVAVLITDARGTIEYVNPKFTEITGYRQEEALGRNPSILKSGLTPAKIYQDLWAAIASGQAWNGELLNRKKNGELFWENTRTSPLSDEQGKISHFIVIKEDITERKQADAELRKLSLAVEHSPSSVVVTDRHGRIEYVNPKFSAVSGYSREEVLGKTPGLLKSGLTPPETYRRLWNTIATGKEWRGKLLNRTKSGQLVWENECIAPIVNEQGEITHYVALKEDITERIRYEEQLVHQATHDPLTGLANRNLLMDRIEQAIANAHRYRHAAAVLLIDLDHFKYINDSLGHAAGDQVVREVARRLGSCAREGDTVARMGGDEFVIVLYRVDNEADVSPVMQRIVDSLAQPLQVDGRKLHVTCSVGASLFPKDGDCAEDLLRNADTAMYRAKEHGRNGYWFYTPDMNTRMMERLTLEASLRHAIEQEQFVLHYQPQVDLKTRRIVGAEALIRWHSADGTLVPPGRFIPLAEETGLIIPIGEWVLAEACRQIRRWQAAGLPGIRLAVNISALQFRQKTFARNLGALLAQHRLQAADLELELTESMLMPEADDAITILQALKALGVQLSLDDFGTGYSSLNYLKRFPLDVLKLDQSFVRDIGAAPGDASIARTVIDLGHSLNLKVIAEGVECAEQLAFLQASGCDRVQGYLFSHPLPMDAFAELLARDAAIPVT